MTIPRRLLRYAAVAGAISWATHAPAQLSQTPKIALVIGNSDYDRDGRVQDGPRPVGADGKRYLSDLPNAKNDAKTMAAMLGKLGFDVTYQHDLDQEELAEAFRRFSRAAQSAPPSAKIFVYYSGHGIQLEERQYLAPVGVRVSNEAAPFYSRRNEFTSDLVPMNELRLPSHDGAEGVNVVVLDACRSNPWPSLAVRGVWDPVRRDYRSVLGSGYPGQGARTVVALAAEPGRFASDGQGEHSPFAQSLLEQVPKSASLQEIFSRVREDVAISTNDQQVPHIYPGTLEQLCLVNCNLSDTKAYALESPRSPAEVAATDARSVAEAADLLASRAKAIAERARRAFPEPVQVTAGDPLGGQDGLISRRTYEYSDMMGESPFSTYHGEITGGVPNGLGVLDFNCTVVMLRARCPLQVERRFSGEFDRGFAFGLGASEDLVSGHSSFGMFRSEGPALDKGLVLDPNGDRLEGTFLGDRLIMGIAWTRSGFCRQPFMGGVPVAEPRCIDPVANAITSVPRSRQTRPGLVCRDIASIGGICPAPDRAASSPPRS